MKAIAINSSPKMEKGNTAAILNPFLEGLHEAGADVELFYTKQMEIRPCQGDLACWFKTPGRCSQKDDMEMLLPKLAEANIWVLATPVYVGSMSGPLKNMIDRILPLVTPFFELHDGHCSHPVREGAIISKLVLVSTCAFWELDNFDPMIACIKDACRNANLEFAGALLRPHYRAFQAMAEKGDPVTDIFDEAKEAGRQLVRDGAISGTTLSAISRPLLPVETYLGLVNNRFQQLLDQLNG
jgi:putative NADPH-quinone reductase